MFLLRPAKSLIDPSFFLKSPKNVFIKTGFSSFDLHAHQAFAEVLAIVLDELTGPSIVTSAAYNMKSLTSIICHTCHQPNRSEYISPILTSSCYP